MLKLEKYYTLKQVAEYMHVSVRTVQRWISDNKLRAIELPGDKFGKPAVRIPASALKEVGFAMQEQPPTPELLGWPACFFEQTFGSLKETPLERDSQGEYEVRTELM
jgi:excisionase family DNA binding protein